MGTSVNRLDLIAAVIDSTSLPKPKAAQAVDAVFAEIVRALNGGQEVRLPGFGSFGVSERKATTGRNPQTGVEIKIPPSRSVRFKPSKGLKDTVNAATQEGGSLQDE